MLGKEQVLSWRYYFVLRSSRHAFVGFATEKEAKKAKESLDKIDCRGFPLSVESKDLMLASLRLIKPKSAHLINKGQLTVWNCFLTEKLRAAFVERTIF